VNALRVLLDDPPFACKNLETKRQASDELLRVLAMVKDSDIDMYVEEMSPDQADVLLKYVYKGFEAGDNSASLLKWHAAIVSRHGLGAIVRAMQVKKTV
jgi:actin related protein 2/3 complex subunit 5